MGIASNLIACAIGVYAGAFIDQNYELPKLPSPEQIGNKVQEYMQSRRKDP